MRLIALPVALLLDRRAVEGGAVGLDHESAFGPVEIDPVLAEPSLGFGEWQVRARKKPEELALELGLRDTEGEAVDHGPQRRSGSACPACGRSQRFEADQAAEVRLAD